MPNGSTVVITYDGLDISDSVLYSSASFDAQMAAVPGTFSIVVKDPDQVFDFVTGREISLEVDGVKLFGGWGFQISKQYAFPAEDTSDVATVMGRQWAIQGTDYNVLLDKLVLRNSAGHETEMIGPIGGPLTDADVIKTTFSTYFDIPTGFDFSDDAFVLDNHTYPTGFRYPTQGVKMREVLELWGLLGAVYYIDADKKLHFTPVQNTLAEWGLSDAPNDLTVAVASGGSVTATRGFVGGTMTEDATSVVNDALVWGGSEWAGDGDIVFARRENTDSITAHNRWQVGEVRVGDQWYHGQGEVDARANVIVNGNESGTTADGTQGLVNPEKQFTGTWWAHQTPSDSTHLIPGQSVPIELQVFSQDGGVTPFSMTVPLRSLRITFPTLKHDVGTAYVQFEGTFGLLMNDPTWLWAFLRGIRPDDRRVVITANNTTVNNRYGSKYQDEPTPATNGSATVFTIPFGYIANTTQVYKDGLLQRRGTVYTESDPEAGEITFAVAPAGGTELWVVAYTL